MASTEDKGLKFERVFEDEYTKDIWKYDLTKSKFGPIEVTIHYKAKYIHEEKQRQKEEKERRKQLLKGPTSVLTANSKKKTAKKPKKTTK